MDHCLLKNYFDLAKGLCPFTEEGVIELYPDVSSVNPVLWPSLASILSMQWVSLIMFSSWYLIQLGKDKFLFLELVWSVLLSVYISYLRG